MRFVCVGWWVGIVAIGGCTWISIGVCGDGKIEGDEVCDDGAANGETLACTSTCTRGDAAPATEDTGTEGPTPIEIACDDQLDDDGDGQIDCEDDDCDQVTPCTWPLALRLDGLVSLVVSVDGQLAGYTDCSVAFEAFLDYAVDEIPCDGCDRVYAGKIRTLSDTCDGGLEGPGVSVQGIDLSKNPDSWIVSSEIDGVWYEIGTFVNDGTGTMFFENSIDLSTDGGPWDAFQTGYALTPQ